MCHYYYTLFSKKFSRRVAPFLNLLLYYRLKIQVEDRLMVLTPDVKERKKAPARPPPPIHVNSQKKIPHSYIPSELNNDQTSVQSWEDARELFSVINSMCKSLMLRVYSHCELYLPSLLLSNKNMLLNFWHRQFNSQL